MLCMLLFYQLITSYGKDFEFLGREETVKRLWTCIKSRYTAHLKNIQERNLPPLPFIAAGPGTGKTRMLIESLNTLQQCAKEEDDVDLREMVNNAMLINVTYGNS